MQRDRTRRILVTGAAGYIGAHLVEALCSWDQADLVIGVDIVEPSFEDERYRFVRRDIREPVVDLVRDHGIETVIHLAYVVAPTHNKEEMKAVNLNGAVNVLDACKSADVSLLIHMSSTTVYGLHPDNDVPLTEQSPLRASGDFTYAENKVRIERKVQRFARDCPQTKVTVLRPCFVVGPGVSHPLVTHLQKKFVPLPWRTPPYQFVHIHDLVRIMLHFLAQPRSDVYNVAADGTVTFSDMLRMLGNYRLRSHWPVMCVVNQLAWWLRLSFVTEVPTPVLQIIRHPWLASAEKLRTHTGYQFVYDSRGAFQDFARAVRASNGREPSGATGSTDTRCITRPC